MTQIVSNESLWKRNNRSKPFRSDVGYRKTFVASNYLLTDPIEETNCKLKKKIRTSRMMKSSFKDNKIERLSHNGFVGQLVPMIDVTRTSLGSTHVVFVAMLFLGTTFLTGLNVYASPPPTDTSRIPIPPHRRQPPPPPRHRNASEISGKGDRWQGKDNEESSFDSTKISENDAFSQSYNRARLYDRDTGDNSPASLPSSSLPDLDVQNYNNIDRDNHLDNYQNYNDHSYNTNNYHNDNDEIYNDKYENQDFYSTKSDEDDSYNSYYDQNNNMSSNNGYLKNGNDNKIGNEYGIEKPDQSWNNINNNRSSRSSTNPPQLSLPRDGISKVKQKIPPPHHQQKQSKPQTPNSSWGAAFSLPRFFSFSQSQQKQPSLPPPPNYQNPKSTQPHSVPPATHVSSTSSSLSPHLFLDPSKPSKQRTPIHYKFQRVPTSDATTKNQNSITANGVESAPATKSARDTDTITQYMSTFSGKIRLIAACGLVGYGMGTFVSKSFGIPSPSLRWYIAVWFMVVATTFRHSSSAFAEWIRALGMTLILLIQRSRYIRQRYPTVPHLKAILFKNRQGTRRVPFPPTRGSPWAWRSPLVPPQQSSTEIIEDENSPLFQKPQPLTPPYFNMLYALIAMIVIGAVVGGNTPIFLLPSWLGSLTGAGLFAYATTLPDQPIGDLARTAGMRAVALLLEIHSIDRHHVHLVPKTLTLSSRVLDKVLIMDRKHRIRDRLVTIAMYVYNFVARTVSEAQTGIQSSAQSQPTQQNRRTMPTDTAMGDNENNNSGEYNRQRRYPPSTPMPSRRDRYGPPTSNIDDTARQTEFDRTYPVDDFEYETAPLDGGASNNEYASKSQTTDTMSLSGTKPNDTAGSTNNKKGFFSFF